MRSLAMGPRLGSSRSARYLPARLGAAWRARHGRGTQRGFFVAPGVEGALPESLQHGVFFLGHAFIVCNMRGFDGITNSHGSMLQIGDPLPDFEAQATSGAYIRMAELRGKAVVLFFFPKAFTPGCVREAKGFGTSTRGSHGATCRSLGISTDPLDAQCRFAEWAGFPFPSSPTLTSPSRGASGCSGRHWGGQARDVRGRRRGRGAARISPRAARRASRRRRETGRRQAPQCTTLTWVSTLAFSSPSLTRPGCSSMGSGGRIRVSFSA